MTIGTVLLLLIGIAAMAALFAVAWWLWTANPAWPWTAAVREPEPQPPRPRRAPAARTSAAKLETGPLPVIDRRSEEAFAEHDKARTLMFVKSKPPEHTQILPEGPALAAYEREEDAPISHDEQSQTKPVARAGSRRPPPQPPRY